jgi:hypothetical protein
VLFALFIPGMLVVCLIDVGFHVQFSATQLWIGALVANLGLLGVWSAFFVFFGFFDRIQTHFSIGLVVALISVFAHFGLHMDFSQVFRSFDFFNSYYKICKPETRFAEGKLRRSPRST